LGHRRGPRVVDIGDEEALDPFLEPLHRFLAVGRTGEGRIGIVLGGIAQQRSELMMHGLGVNVAQLVPHGSIRAEILGMADRGPDREELAAMKTLVHNGMEQGAWGLSSGTFYRPASFSDNSELVELAKIAAHFGGIYTSHIRDESNYNIGLVAAVDEVIEVGREAGIVAVISHIKALGPPVWGLSTTVVDQIEEARSQGHQIYADQYPYLASSTGLVSALLPGWAVAGGGDSLFARLDDPATFLHIKTAMVENLARRGGADRIQISRFEADPTLDGKLLSELAEEQNMLPVDKAVDLIRKGGARIISYNMHNDDVRMFMSQQWTLTSSDGGLPKFGLGVPHPRSYGAFPRKIAKFVFQENVLTLEAAIRSMTSLPAEVLNMSDRGRLAEGQIADVVVFSRQFTDNATFTEPHQLSTGVIHLFLNGESAILDSEFTGMRLGQVLAKPSSE